MKPVLYGLAGPQLTGDELAFFKEADPAGYILFGRNVVDRDQLRALTDDLRAIHGRETLAIAIDQEGGRVQRMAGTQWPAYPPWDRFDRLYRLAPITAMEAARLNALAIAHDLAEVGITVNCLPLLDIRQPDASDIIGDRSLGDEPMQVAALGRMVLDGLAGGGVVGVVKHIPGHGRALVDSHLALPVVTASAGELEVDLAPFRALSDAPMAMTAHLVYTAWDAERCATLSPTVIADIIRGRIGFDGFLMSDDIDMQALSGDIGTIAAAAVSAGCDAALNCWGRMDDMIAIAGALGEMPDRSRQRLERALANVHPVVPGGDRDALIAQRDALLAQLA